MVDEVDNGIGDEYKSCSVVHGFDPHQDSLCLPAANRAAYTSTTFFVGGGGGL